MSNRQEAEFYVTQPNWEMVWEGKRYYVIRNGDMRIHFGDEVIRYTDQLLAAGIGSDRVLSALNISSGLAETHDLFQVIDSPWFEVVDREEYDDLESEIYHSFDEAVSRAQELERELASN